MSVRQSQLLPTPPSPIPDRRLHRCQGRDGGGVGAEDAGAEGDGGDEGMAAQQAPFVFGEAAFRADQHGERSRAEGAEARQRVGGILVFIAEDQAAAGVGGSGSGGGGGCGRGTVWVGGGVPVCV